MPWNLLHSTLFPKYNKNLVSPENWISISIVTLEGRSGRVDKPSTLDVQGSKLEPPHLNIKYSFLIQNHTVFESESQKFFASTGCNYFFTKLIWCRQKEQNWGSVMFVTVLRLICVKRILIESLNHVIIMFHILLFSSALRTNS